VREQGRKQAVQAEKTRHGRNPTTATRKKEQSKQFAGDGCKQRRKKEPVGRYNWPRREEEDNEKKKNSQSSFSSHHNDITSGVNPSSSPPPPVEFSLSRYGCPNKPVPFQYVIK